MKSNVCCISDKFLSFTLYVSVAACHKYQQCWATTCDGLAPRPGESVQLHSKLRALNETDHHYPEWSPNACCMGLTLPFTFVAAIQDGY